MKAYLTIEGPAYRSLMAHLLPPDDHQEQAAFPLRTYPTRASQDLLRGCRVQIALARGFHRPRKRLSRDGRFDTSLSDQAGP